LPPAVDAFFSRALCRSPDGRFQSAGALADELAAIAEGRSEAIGTSTRAVAPRGEETLSLAGSQVLTTPTRARSRWRSWRTWATVAVGAVGTVALWFAMTPRRAPPALATAPPEPPATAVAPPPSATQDEAPAQPVRPPVARPERRPARHPHAPPPQADPKPPPVDPKFGLPTGSR
jgi:hypothetical protein